MNLYLRGCRRFGITMTALLILAPIMQLSANPSKPLMLGGVNYPGDLPTLAADKQRLFEAEGVSIQVSYASSGKDNLARLRNGDIDAATMALSPLVLDYLNDPDPGNADDLVILANLAHAYDLKQIVTLDPGASPDPRWFAGKRLGLVKGSSAEFFWFQFSLFHGIDLNSVQLVHYPAPSLPQALIGGEIDAAAMWEPWVSTTERQASDRLLRLDHGNIYVAKWVLVTRREIVEAEPEQLQALLRAYRHAIEFIERHPAQAAEMYSAASGVDADTLTTQIDAQNYDLNLDWSLLMALQQEFEWAQRAGYAPSSSPGRPLGLIAADLLKELFPMAVAFPGDTGDTDGKPDP